MIAQTPMLAIQVAIFEALDSDGTLDTAVYDFVPEDAPYPYIAIGEAYETPDNVQGKFERNTVITLHVWTRSRGTRDGLAIKDRIVELLDHTPLDVDGFHHVATRFEFSQTLRDPDPELRHTVVRFRIATEQQEGS